MCNLIISTIVQRKKDACFRDELHLLWDELYKFVINSVYLHNPVIHEKYYLHTPHYLPVDTS